MAKNVAGLKPKSGNGAANAPASTSEQPESLDQVRDILFGGQMRMVDARLRSLEERIALEQTTMRTSSVGRSLSSRRRRRKSSRRTRSACRPSAPNARTI